jgi:hypothetical protein
MATPKEQHDARSNARMIGTGHRRTLPADAMPPGRAPASTEHAIREPARAPAIDEPRRDEPSPSARERRPSLGDPPRS